MRHAVTLAALAVVLAVAAPANAQSWPTVESCIADIGGGDPDSIVQISPSLFSNEKTQSALDWCENHRSQREYRLSELGKAGIGFLVITASFKHVSYSSVVVLVKVHLVSGPVPGRRATYSGANRRQLAWAISLSGSSAQTRGDGRAGGEQANHWLAG